MSNTSIVLVTSDREEVLMDDSVARRWELFDNVGEWHDGSSNLTIQVPFTFDVITTWLDIDSRVEIVSEGGSVNNVKYPLEEYEMVCRFFIPKHSYHWLFLEMTKLPSSREETQRVYECVLQALMDVYRSGYTRFIPTLSDAMQEVRTKDTRDIFVHLLHHSLILILIVKCSYESRVTIYEQHKELIDMLVTDSMKSESDYIRVLKLFDNTTSMYPYFTSNIPFELGLGCLFKTDCIPQRPSSIVTIGQKLLETYTITGPGKYDVEWPHHRQQVTIVKKGGVRPLVEHFIAMGIGHVILKLYKCYAMYYHVDKRLNRFANILSKRLARQ